MGLMENEARMMIKVECKSNSKIKLWILFFFITFPAWYSWGSMVIGASIAHIMLVIFVYVPLLAIFGLKKEPFFRCYLYFAMAIVFIFVFYMVVNIGTSFMFESYALPSCFSFFSGIVGFYIMVIQEDSKGVINVLKCACIILTLYYFMYSNNVTSMATYQYGYDMYLGFMVLMPCILSLNFALSKQNTKSIFERIFWWCMFAISIFIILAYGSRGPIIGIVFYLIMKYVTLFIPRKDISTNSKIGITLLVIILLVIFVISFNTIIGIISEKFVDLGISSRTITRLLNSTMGYDNGRNGFYKKAFSEYTLLGHGPFSDQFYFGEGNYCHNFFVEFFFDFGLIGGTLGIFILMITLIKIIKFNYRSKWFELFILFFCYSVGRLMTSGTFWSETYFWMMIGLAVLVLMDIRNCNQLDSYSSPLSI